MNFLKKDMNLLKFRIFSAVTNTETHLCQLNMQEYRDYFQDILENNKLNLLRFITSTMGGL